jgi:putative toxin-antitoxin system antitoxin component (TIGR02293 family)
MPSTPTEKEKQDLPRDVAKFVRFVHAGAPGPYSYVVLLGINEFDSAKLLRSVRRGLSFRAFERFQRNAGLSQAQVSSLMQIASRTLTRRREEGRFRPDESDRLLRAGRVFGRALELFEGDTKAARRWLSNPQPALGGAIPLELAETEVGAREVEAAIGRIEHGVFS